MATGVYFSSHKKRMTAFWLCVFTGIFGGHYFYVGRTIRGFIAFCTLNFFFIGWVFDMGKILHGRFKDRNGLPLID